MTIEAKRAARRAAMPIVSALVEELAEFSPKVIYARENGIRVGKPEQHTEVFTIPPGYRQATNVEKAKR